MDDLILGVIIGTVGGMVGTMLAMRTGGKPEGPVCACGHHKCFHATTGSGCSKCSCWLYVGPQLDAAGNTIPQDRP